jgi:hypothetical protein
MQARAGGAETRPLPPRLLSTDAEELAVVHDASLHVVKRRRQARAHASNAPRGTALGSNATGAGCDVKQFRSTGNEKI